MNTYYKNQYGQENRWDYVFGYDAHAYFVEFHPAKDSEVNVILKKLEWLKSWLKTKAPCLRQIPHTFHWIPDGKCRILPESKYARQLKGINLVRQHTWRLG